MAPTIQSSAMTPRSSNAKLQQVTSILAKLKTDLKQNNILPQQRNTLLEELKVHGRAIENADPIFTRDGIEILARYGFESSSTATSREALRCLANALLLQPRTRQTFVDLGFGDKAADKAKSDSVDDEFLISRILFLLTYDSDLDFAVLVTSHHLADSINAAIARHSKRYSRSSRRNSRDVPMSMNTMALSETLKLLFNITHHYPALNVNFTKSISHIFKILARHKIPSPPLQPPVNYLVNALINLDLEEGRKNGGSPHSSAAFPKFDAKCNAEHLINILDQAISGYPETELDTVASPVLTLIRRVYEIAPDAVKTYMEGRLLPTDDERSRPLGKSDTLSARLLRLSTSALTPGLRGSISSMMFELSSKDAAKFVHNVGYGFASGFLMSHNIAMPESALEAFANGAQGDGNGAEKVSVPVNPITGQRIDAEEPAQGPPMTREEKEREAERLFVLFERLKATGVMNVQNPMEKAVQEGRFEELDDDADE